jgi:hypothetical protein
MIEGDCVGGVRISRRRGLGTFFAGGLDGAEVDAGIVSSDIAAAGCLFVDDRFAQGW